MAKRASKRVSEKRKTKRAEKNARSEAKERRKQRASQKMAVKVPRSVLLTSDQKKHLNEIKAASKERSMEINSLPVVEEPEIIKNVRISIFDNKCDVFIEVIDSRDIEGSRCRLAEEEIIKEGKKLYSYVEKNIVVDGLNPLNNFSDLKGYRLCIFGNIKSGKFILSKKIEDFFNSNEIFFDFIRTPCNTVSVSEVLRNQIDLEKIDPVFMIYQFWSFINKKSLKELYMVPEFSSLEEFLESLAEKYFDEVNFNYLKKSKNITVKAGYFFLKDIKGGRFGWSKSGNTYSFSINKV